MSSSLRRYVGDARVLSVRQISGNADEILVKLRHDGNDKKPWWQRFKSADFKTRAYLKAGQ